MRMEILRRLGIIAACYYLLVVNCLSLQAQCPTADFTTKAALCLSENMEFVDNSTGGINYQWDFCEGELDDTPTASSVLDLSGLNLPRGLSIAKDGENWYGFLTSKGNNRLIRISFGNSLSNNPSGFENLGNIDDLFNNPEPIKLLQEAGEWFALVHNGGNGNLLRLSFGNSLGNIPSASIVASGVGGNNTSMDFGRSNDSLVVVFVNPSAKLNLVNFGNSIQNTPGLDDIVETANIGGLTNSRNISLIKTCDQWVGFSVSNNLRRLYRLDFGTSLFSEPTVTTIANNVFGADNPYRLNVEFDDNEYFIFIVSQFGSFFRIELGSDIQNNTPNVVSLGDLGILNGNFSLAIVNDQSNWHAFSLNSTNNELNRIDFPSTCSANNPIASANLPTGVNYSVSGTYNIGMMVTDEDGNVDRITKQITVSATEAPDISFTDGNTACATLSNAFSGTNASAGQTITTWNWDFGDGTTALDAGPNPAHQFSVPMTQVSDTFQVKLDVISDNGCQNNVVNELIIYQEPTPDFELVEALSCTNKVVEFSNITPGDYGDVISWNWIFDDGETSSEENPMHEFANPGDYNVRLQAIIPGCTTETNMTVNVVEGADVEFDFSNDCLVNAIAFTNQTTGAGITGYQWDFGDGVNSTQENPTHTYTTPGDYTVRLTVDNNLGCSIINEQTITIHAIPQVAFINELACSNGSTQFTDQTTVDDANITGWLWDFGDGNTSTEQNPIHLYENSGSFTVRLTTTSNFGCQSFLERSVEVITGPTVDFTTNSVCLGETTIFQDLSTPADGATINSWFWEIDGDVFTDQNPEVDFPESGTYSISLTVTSSTFCTASITKDIVINPLPVADFNTFDACTDSNVRFENASVAEGDEISAYNWDIGGLSTSENENPTFVFTQPGTYQVSLDITTANNCTANVSKSVLIGEKPTAAFTTDVTQGPPPLAVSFQNASVDATSFSWDFGTNNNDVSDVQSPIFTYTDLGVFEAQLIATANNGCADTAIQAINIVDPNLDLAIENITTVIDGGQTQMVVNLRNNGTLFINETNLAISIGNEAIINETINESIAPGESFVYVVGATVTNTNTVKFVCATATPLVAGFEETNLDNNTFCFNQEDKTTIIKPFPNPSADNITISVILESQQKVILSMYDAFGKPVVLEEFDDTQEGLNEYNIDVSTVVDGMYLIKLQYGGLHEVFRVFVEK